MTSTASKNLWDTLLKCPSPVIKSVANQLDVIGLWSYRVEHPVFERRLRDLIMEQFSKTKVVPEMLGGMDQVRKLPVLRWQPRFMGYTDYLDRFRAEDLTDSVMIGIDNYRRIFVAFKVQYEGKVGVVVLFQRYTDDYVRWSDARRSSIDCFQTNGHWLESPRYNEQVYDNVQRLLRGEDLLVRDWNSDELLPKEYRLATDQVKQ